MLPILLVTGIGGAFSDFYNPRIILATRNMRFGPLATFQIFQKVASLALAIGLALYYESFWAIIIGNSLGAVLASLSSYFLIPYRPRFTLERFREIWTFSSWLFLSQLCETLNWRFDQLVIGLVVRKAELGTYSVADNLAVIPAREMSIPLRNALFAGMAGLNNAAGDLRHPFLRAQSTLAMVAAPASIGLALVAEPAVRVMLGDSWLNCVVFVQILAINYALETLTVVIKPLVMAMGKTKLLFLTQLPALIVRIPLVTIGLLTGGLVGAALGSLMSGVVLCLISLLLPQFLLGLSVWKQLRSHATTFAALGAMSFALLSAKGPVHAAPGFQPAAELLIMASLGVAVYSGSILLLWIATGKPDGPVSEIAGTMRSFLAAKRNSRDAVEMQ